MSRAINVVFMLFIAGCGQSCDSCWKKGDPPPPPPPPPTCGDQVCNGTEDCSTCPDCQCPGGTCERGTCIPAGYAFKGCVKVGQSCTDSLCPALQCTTTGALSAPKLCSDKDIPIPCICHCR